MTASSPASDRELERAGGPRTRPAHGTLRTGVVLVALALTFGLVQLDATIVNVALQTMRRDLGGGVDAAQWVVDGYAVPFAACMLTAGVIGDRLGHRRSCVLGFVVFALASVVAALADGWAMLITARGIQGVGAAIMLPASLALVSRLYPDERARSRALGVWGGVASTGFAAGPVVGGLLITHAGWPAIFWINVPATVLVAGTILLLAPAGRPHQRRSEPVATVLIIVALAGVAGGIIELGRGQFIVSLLAVVLGVVAGASFVGVERRSRHPLLPPSLVRSGRFRWALVTGLVFNFGMYGALLCVSLSLQAAYGFSALTGGLAVLPMALVIAVGATGSGFLAASFGPRRPMIAGFCAAGVGAVVMTIGAFAGSPVWIIVGLSLIGLLSLAMPSMTGVALAAAPAAHAGLVGGALNSARQMGGALGVAVLGAMLGAGGFRTGLGLASLVTAAVCMFGVLSAVRATDTASANGRWPRS